MCDLKLTFMVYANGQQRYLANVRSRQAPRFNTVRHPRRPAAQRIDDKWSSEYCHSHNSAFHRTTYRVPKSLSGSDPIRLRFDDFELDEANAWLLLGTEDRASGARSSC